jgi:5'-3' exonuclease
MFGLPYIIAPMEAEAQCAYMDTIELVDGVVTDDSDVFLFGGRSVYKNLFDDRKYVETYYMKVCLMPTLIRRSPEVLPTVWCSRVRIER